MKKNNAKFAIKMTVLLLSLIVMVFVGSLAWFTFGTKAYADGLGVRAKADGVQVSWDGVNYYDNLTATDKSQVVDSVRGMSYFYNPDDNNSPEILKLISGNGLNFFEPYVNRRTGQVFMSADGTSYEGIEVNDSNSEGRYIDVPLYFRSTTERAVYLAGDSRVEPKYTSSRMSDYGDFSKDHISAASRVAFLDEDKENCSFIWAPNSNVELKESEAGYTLVKDHKLYESGGSGSGGELDGGAEDNDNKYYLWTIAPTADYNGGDQRKITNSYEFVYDANIRYFVATFDVIVPRYQAEYPSIPFLISQSGNSPVTNTYSIDRGASFNGNHPESLLKISNEDYNAATFNNQQISANNCSQFYMTKTNTLIQSTKVTVRFGFNPQTGVVTVLGYQGNDSWDYDGTPPVKPVSIKYYELDNTETNCALVNQASGIAVSSSEHFKKSVLFKDSTKESIWPISITIPEQFTAMKSGDGYEATYKFKSKGTKKFLSIAGGKLSLGDSVGSDFTLDYVEGVTGPVLKSGDYYLVVKNGNITAVTADELVYSEIVTIYTGDAYTVIDNGALESYHFLDSANGLQYLNANSTPPLYASRNDASETTTVGVKIADINVEKEFEEAIEWPTSSTDSTTSSELTEESKTAKTTYYTAKIYIRIWVEGTDREAKTPLAGGIFNTKLHFKSQ